MYGYRLLSRKSALSALLTFAYLVGGQPTASAAVSEWVEIEIRHGHLLVESAVEGIPGHSVIDSGAEMNGINERFLTASELSYRRSADRVKVTGVFGTDFRSLYYKIPVEIFGSTVDFKNIVELNLGPPEYQIILGAGFLKEFVFQFDYPKNRMRVITHDSIDLRKLKNVDSRKDRRGGSPLVKVRLNDERNVWLLMDTGNNGGVVVDRLLAKKYDWLQRYDTDESTSAGVNTTGRMQRFQLPSMSFGPYNIEDAIIAVPAEGETLELFAGEATTGSRIETRNREADGLLGFDVLKHFVVTIDYKRGDVHIVAGSPEGDD